MPSRRILLLIPTLILLTFTSLSFLSPSSPPLSQQLRAAYSTPHEWLASAHGPLYFAPGPIMRRPKFSIGMRRIQKPPPIIVNQSMPALDGLPHVRPLYRAYTSALDSLSTAAQNSLQTTFLFGEDSERDGLLDGVPGTNITSPHEAARLQGYLDCATSLGEWVYNPKGDTSSWERFTGDEKTITTTQRLTVHKQSSAFAKCDASFYKGRSPNPDTYHDWDVRDSLKFRWKPSKSCSSLLPMHMLVKEFSLLDRSQFCRLLRHKNILIVGDSATSYVLHDLLLDWTLEKPATCYGDLYCNMHALCAGARLHEDVPNKDGPWHHDDRVFNSLPLPVVAEPHVKFAKRAPQYSVPNHPHPFGTLLRYRRSDGLYMSMSPSAPRHKPVFIHPATGIREVNNFALADAHRSDVLVIGKSPLPLPEESTASSSVSPTMAHWTKKLMQGPWVGEQKAALVVEAVEDITLKVWLPELIDSLYKLRRAGSPPDQLIFYKSAWRNQGECNMPHEYLDMYDEWPDPRKGFDWLGWWNSTGDGGAPPLRRQVTLERLVYSGYPSGSLTDVHTLFYNLQVVLQNHIVRTLIAPKLGIVYLDFETPLSIWRCGLVGNGDCLRPCLPSPGFALEDTFIGGLHNVFAWGWDGEGRDEEWVGEAFVPLREREKIRKKEQKLLLQQQEKAQQQLEQEQLQLQQELEQGQQQEQEQVRIPDEEVRFPDDVNNNGGELGDDNIVDEAEKPKVFHL